MLTIKAIVKAIGETNISLYKGEGYFYFVYDGDGVYREHTVMVNTVNQLPLESWVYEAKLMLNGI